jgi:hypothetical protein
MIERDHEPELELKKAVIPAAQILPVRRLAETECALLLYSMGKEEKEASISGAISDAPSVKGSGVSRLNSLNAHDTHLYRSTLIV